MVNKNILEKTKKYVNKLLVPLGTYYYHNYNHALEVSERALYLGEKEGLNKNDLEILALSGLFHDTGFVIQYDNNEHIGAKIASNFLKGLLYSEKNIEIIKRLIKATNPEYKNPKDILEKIIKDADMDNLGREDFRDKANFLKKEIELVKKIKIKDPEWNHGLIELLKEYKYSAKTQKHERDKKKEENLKNMLKELEKEEF